MAWIESENRCSWPNSAIGVCERCTGKDCFRRNPRGCCFTHCSPYQRKCADHVNNRTPMPYDEEGV